MRELMNYTTPTQNEIEEEIQTLEEDIAAATV